MESQEKIIKTVQSSTQKIVDSFLNKTKSLIPCEQDIQSLIRNGFNSDIAYSTALEFFGTDNVPFIAIDGTMNQYIKLDILVFYCGAFGYSGQINFKKDNIVSHYEMGTEDTNVNISSAIPIHESYASLIASNVTEGGLELDVEKVPSALMHFAEYFMAVKAIIDKPYARIIILDRQLAIDVPHLISEATKLLEEEKECVLEELETESGTISKLDL